MSRRVIGSAFPHSRGPRHVFEKAERSSGLRSKRVKTMYSMVPYAHIPNNIRNSIVPIDTAAQAPSPSKPTLRVGGHLQASPATQPEIFNPRSCADRRTAGPRRFELLKSAAETAPPGPFRLPLIRLRVPSRVRSRVPSPAESIYSLHCSRQDSAANHSQTNFLDSSSLASCLTRTSLASPVSELPGCAFDALHPSQLSTTHPIQIVFY